MEQSDPDDVTNRLPTDAQKILIADVHTLTRLLTSALNLAAMAGVEIELINEKVMTQGIARHELTVETIRF